MKYNYDTSNINKGVDVDKYLGGGDSFNIEDYEVFLIEK